MIMLTAEMFVLYSFSFDMCMADALWKDFQHKGDTEAPPIGIESIRKCVGFCTKLCRYYISKCYKLIWYTSINIFQ